MLDRRGPKPLLQRCSLATLALPLAALDNGYVVPFGPGGSLLGKQLATVLLLGALVAGCAAGQENQIAVDPDIGTDENGIDAASTTGAGQTMAEAYISPISQALGVAQNESTEAFDAYAADAEELTRQCMADRGFEYAPAPAAGGSVDQVTRRQSELRNSLTQQQFTDQYGFGVATLFELNFKDQGVVDFINQRYGAAPSVATTSAEQEAYEMALTGQFTLGGTAAETQEALFGDGPTGPQPGSCRDYGLRTAPNPGAVFDGLFSLLGDELDQLDERFENDPRIRAATAEWQVCMAQLGHEFEDRAEIIDEIQQEANDLADEFLSSPTIEGAIESAARANFLAMDTDERMVFLEEIGALQGFSWIPSIHADFDDLIAFELAIATESAECEDRDLFDVVRTELEIDFVAQHGAKLALIAVADD